jgi:hypothetical protein
MEEVSWRQTYRVWWLQVGDKCSIFVFCFVFVCFHKMANSNYRRNFIESLLIDDTISTNRSEISKHIFQFYKKLLTEKFSWRLVMEGLCFDSIDEAEASWLERDLRKGRRGRL